MYLGAFTAWFNYPALVDTAWAITVRFVLSGEMLSLGLAVAFKLREYVSPVLVLRLLRLFLPIVLMVVAVVIAVLPFRGLSQLFGALRAELPLGSAAPPELARCAEAGQIARGTSDAGGCGIVVDAGFECGTYFSRMPAGAV